ncbi:MAG: hypothetical protein Q9162_002031 [Coniocarpon cinnabarinum]
MVLHNPNNWHWVNKDTSGWAKSYLESELLGLSVEEDGVSAQIAKILSMDGDVDVSQRKGKVITLFDVVLKLEWEGKTKEGESCSGTINVPEVAHDTEEDEYVFEIEIYSETAPKEAVKDLIRRKLTPSLRAKLVTLAPALIDAHAKDIQHDQNYKSGFTPAKTYTNSSSLNNGPKQADAPQVDASVATSKSNVNVTTLTASDEFRTDAEQLYITFTDPSRVAAFTRAPPEPFEPQVGGAFRLFGGNVQGTFQELQPPTKIVQKWRLAQWPAGHFSTLKVEFDQNDVDAVTVMRVEWQGVPVGQEEVTRRNWETYYVRAMKVTFGFGTVL